MAHFFVVALLLAVVPVLSGDPFVLAAAAVVTTGLLVHERRGRSRRRELERELGQRVLEIEREKEIATLKAAKLAELDRARSALFANMSHELRTPLALLLGPLRDLGDGRFGSLEPRIWREVERMRANAERLAALAGQMLDTARLEVESRAGEGSVFVVGLKLGRAHFREEQIAEKVTDAAGVATGRTQHSAGITEKSRTQLEIVRRRLGLEHDDAEPAHDPLDDKPKPDEDDDRTCVLVVDDHPDLRTYIRRHLEDRYRVVEAADGAQALERARQHVPDLVVSDLMMPPNPFAPPNAPRDGLALCRAIKRDPELEFIPVVLLSASGSPEAKLAGLAECADDLVTKPFDARVLRARIDNLIAVRRRLRERLLLEASKRALTIAPQVDPGTNGDRSFLERVFSVIDDGMSDENFRVESLAERLAMSRSSLYSHLDEIGQSPGSLILERRLRRAAGLLSAGAGSVGEVACAVGFKSVSHFTQRFRERYGTTPSSYRRHAA